MTVSVGGRECHIQFYAFRVVEENKAAIASLVLKYFADPEDFEINPCATRVEQNKPQRDGSPAGRRFKTPSKDL